MDGVGVVLGILLWHLPVNTGGTFSPSRGSTRARSSACRLLTDEVQMFLRGRCAGNGPMQSKLFTGDLEARRAALPGMQIIDGFIMYCDITMTRGYKTVFVLCSFSNSIIAQS